MGAGVRTATSRRAVQGAQHVPRRRMGFLSDLKRDIQAEVEKNKELKEALDKFKGKGKRGGKTAEPQAGAEADASKAEADAARAQSRAEAKEKADAAYQAAKETAEKGAEQSKEALKAGKEMIGSVFGKMGEMRSKVSETLGANESVKLVRDAADELRDKVKDTEAAKKAKEAADKVGKAASGLGDGAAGVMENKHELGTKTGYFKDINEKPKEEVPEEEWDTDTTTLVQVKSQETEWDRTKARWREAAQRHPVLRGIWNFSERAGEKAGAAAGNMGDRMFGETDEALTVYEIKERDPEFAMMGFMKEVREVIIPEVLEAYLKADEPTLKARCADKAYQAMFASMQERRHQGLTFDPRIIQIDDVQLSGARVLDNGPTLVVTFNAQQIHCIRDKNGLIVDGADDDIRSVYYTWAFQLDQDAYDLNWQLVEMQTMGAMKMI